MPRKKNVQLLSDINPSHKHRTTHKPTFITFHASESIWRWKLIKWWTRSRTSEHLTKFVSRDVPQEMATAQMLRPARPRQSSWCCRSSCGRWQPTASLDSSATRGRSVKMETSWSNTLNGCRRLRTDGGGTPMLRTCKSPDQDNLFSAQSRESGCTPTHDPFDIL